MSKIGIQCECQKLESSVLVNVKAGVLLVSCRKRGDVVTAHLYPPMIDYIVLHPAQEYFTYMETSPLPVKSCKI
jgi:hypothetical protein